MRNNLVKYPGSESTTWRTDTCVWATVDFLVNVTRPYVLAPMRRRITRNLTIRRLAPALVDAVGTRDTGKKYNARAKLFHSWTARLRTLSLLFHSPPPLVSAAGGFFYLTIYHLPFIGRRRYLRTALVERVQMPRDAVIFVENDKLFRRWTWHGKNRIIPVPGNGRKTSNRARADGEKSGGPTFTGTDV